MKKSSGGWWEALAKLPPESQARVKEAVLEALRNYRALQKKKASLH